MRGQLAQTGHCVCKYMQLEHEHVEAVITPEILRKLVEGLR